MLYENSPLAVPLYSFGVVLVKTAVKFFVFPKREFNALCSHTGNVKFSLQIFEFKTSQITLFENIKCEFGA